jgi:hypothetical protein
MVASPAEPKDLGDFRDRDRLVTGVGRAEGGKPPLLNEALNRAEDDGIAYFSFNKGAGAGHDLFLTVAGEEGNEREAGEDHFFLRV